MALITARAKDDSYGIYEYIMEGVEKAKEFEFPKNMTSPYSRAKQFKRVCPEYHKIPNSILRGLFKFGIAKSDGMMGLRLPKRDVLHVWGLGYLNLLDRVSGTVRQVTFLDDYTLEFYALGKRMANKKIVFKNYANQDLSQLLKDDPIFRYLKVNGVFAEYGHKKACIIHDVIEHFEKNPDLTRRDLERMGVGFDSLSRESTNLDQMSLSYNYLWDIMANYQESLDTWIRAGSKPKEGEYERGHYILSSGQHKKRMDREWSLSEHLNSSDVEAGKVKKQSFDSMTYNTIRTDKSEWGFFN